jgi:hypothetical protein
MNHDTPLAEVAQLLPQEGAQALLRYPLIIQQNVLTNLRLILMTWEMVNVELDPIQFEAVVNSFVITMAASTSVMADAVQGLSQRLSAAEFLNETYKVLLEVAQKGAS